MCNSDMSGRADCDSINTVRNRVETIEKQDGGTDLWSGLAYVTDSVCPMLREDSHKTLITITDGSPSDEENVRALAEARAEFNQMLAVGVGEDLNENVLRKLTSSVEPIHVTDFSALDEIVEEMKELLCADVQKLLRSE